MTELLVHAGAPAADLLVRGAHVLDPRVADCGDALIETQVRNGQVVRMAVLYDLLVGGPVGVRALAAAEVA